MNEYNYDYMNYITTIPNSMQNNYNSGTNNNSVNELNKTSNNSNILDPYEGFIRGNIFGNSYIPYKNYKPLRINPSNEREALLNQWQQYNFATLELNLYLDTNPNDVDAIKLFNSYNNVLKQITKKYEDNYGPICIDDAKSNDKFNWVNGPWPWEGVK